MRLTPELITLSQWLTITLDEFEELLQRQLTIIEMLGDSITAETRERMAKQLEGFRFQQDIEQEEEDKQMEIDLL